MRIGQGFDVHAFGEGDHVMLGGVRIPYGRGVVAHSDGDVIIHALCDAVLGGLGRAISAGIFRIRTRAIGARTAGCSCAPWRR